VRWCQGVLAARPTRATLADGQADTWPVLGSALKDAPSLVEIVAGVNSTRSPSRHRFSTFSRWIIWSPGKEQGRYRQRKPIRWPNAISINWPIVSPFGLIAHNLQARDKRGSAHGIGDRGLPQEVLEPPCVHSPGRQCVSGRMHRERQPSSLASPFYHASNAHAAKLISRAAD
jgi:hypothetical protein